MKLLLPASGSRGSGVSLGRWDDANCAWAQQTTRQCSLQPSIQLPTLAEIYQAMVLIVTGTIWGLTTHQHWWLRYRQCRL